MVKVKLLTDFPDGLARKGELWLWDERRGKRPCRVTEIRTQQQKVVASIEGVDTMTAAEELRGALLMVDRDHLEPLPEDTFYRHDILGLAVEDETGRRLGRVEDIWETGANDVWVVRGEGGEILVPAVRTHVVGVDLAGRVARVAGVGATEE
jgi:16S rRNA processing protein RimM